MTVIDVGDFKFATIFQYKARIFDLGDTFWMFAPGANLKRRWMAKTVTRILKLSHTHTFCHQHRLQRINLHSLPRRWWGRWGQINCLENVNKNICLFLARRGQFKTIVTVDTICIARRLDVSFQSFTKTRRTILFIRSLFGIIYNHC